MVYKWIFGASFYLFFL